MLASELLLKVCLLGLVTSVFVGGGNGSLGMLSSIGNPKSGSGPSLAATKGIPNHLAPIN